MASAIHRVTLIYYARVNTPDYSLIEYIINPDMSAVAGIPRHYRKIVGDSVLPMTVDERAAVDDAINQEKEDNEIQESARGIHRRLLLTMIEEFNVLRPLHGLADRTPQQFRNRMRQK